MVQKYGGTSVGSIERIREVARRAGAAKEEGHRVIVVVSAMAGETNRLRALARQVADRPADAEIFPNFNPDEAARRITRDMKAAGIAKRTFGGKADFHSLRTTHVNLGIELGFDVKTAQTLARHKTAEMTLNVYGRSNPERLRGAVESLDAAITGAEIENRSRNSPKEVQREGLPLAVGKLSVDPSRPL
jgi:aspartate kinase